MSEVGLLGWAHPRFTPLSDPIEVGTLEEFEKVMLAVGGKVRKQNLGGKKGLLVSCPYIGHGQGLGDRKPSLWVGFSPGGRWELRCFANCREEGIVKAFEELGILFVSNLKNERKVVKEHDYQIFGEDGKLIAVHHRIDFENGEKSFEWRSPDGKKGLKVKVASLPLYKMWDLPEGCPEVWICEGEKVTEALWERGIPSVGIYGCNVIPEDEVLKKLLSKLAPEGRIILSPDCDPPGREAMHKLAQKFLELGWSALYWLDLEGDAGYDLADFLQENPSPEAFEELKRKIRPYLPPLPTASEFLNKSSTHQDFLIEELLPRGAVAFLVARPKVGKSMLASFLAKALVKGEPFLGMLTEPSRVLYIDYERPLLTAERLADLGVAEEVFLLPGCLGDQPLTIKNLSFLRGLIKRYGLSFIILDTALPFFELRGEQDLNSYSKVYPLLLQLKQLASETSCSFLLIHHLRKSAASDTAPPELGILGSTALSAVADVIMGLLKKEETFELTIQGNAFQERKLTFTINGDEMVLTEPSDLPEVERTASYVLEYLKEKGKASRKELIEWCSTYYPYKKKFALEKLVGRALKRLVLTGVINKQGIGKNTIYELQLLQKHGQPDKGINVRDVRNPSKPKNDAASKTDIFTDTLRTTVSDVPKPTSHFRDISQYVSKMSLKHVRYENKEYQGFPGFRDIRTSTLSVNGPSQPLHPEHHPGPVEPSAPTEQEGVAEMTAFNNKVLESSSPTSSLSSSSEPDPYAHLFHPQAREWLNALAKDPSLRDRQKCPCCKKVGQGDLVFGEGGEVWLECPSCGSLFKPQV